MYYSLPARSPILPNERSNPVRPGDFTTSLLQTHYGVFSVSSVMSLSSTNAYKGLDRAFCIRMKSTLTKRGCHFKSSGYRVSTHTHAHAHIYTFLIRTLLLPRYTWGVGIVRFHSIFLVIYERRCFEGSRVIFKPKLK